MHINDLHIRIFYITTSAYGRRGQNMDILVINALDHENVVQNVENQITRNWNVIFFFIIQRVKARAIP